VGTLRVRLEAHAHQADRMIGAGVGLLGQAQVRNTVAYQAGSDRRSPRVGDPGFSKYFLPVIQETDV
jgi:hypothetical protein